MSGRHCNEANEPTRKKQMKIIRNGSASWAGGIKDGKGAISTESGALTAYPYGFASRFEGKRGTNPEELLGAVYAGCFTIAMSQVLAEAGLIETQIDTSAKVTLEQAEGSITVTQGPSYFDSYHSGYGQRKFSAINCQKNSQLPGVQTVPCRSYTLSQNALSPRQFERKAYIVSISC
jgi:lipoyl-dependent peroxiredoxin